MDAPGRGTGCSPKVWECRRVTDFLDAIRCQANRATLLPQSHSTRLGPLAHATAPRPPCALGKASPTSFGMRLTQARLFNDHDDVPRPTLSRHAGRGDLRPLLNIPG